MNNSATILNRQPKTIVTCDCRKCGGITVEVPAAIAKAGIHAAVVLATQPYAAGAGCRVISR
jgi:hypothetical protein